MTKRDIEEKLQNDSEKMLQVYHALLGVTKAIKDELQEKHIDYQKIDLLLKAVNLIGEFVPCYFENEIEMVYFKLLKEAYNE